MDFTEQDKEIEYLLSMGIDQKEEKDTDPNINNLDYWIDKIKGDYYYQQKETKGLNIPIKDKIGDFYLREYYKGLGEQKKPDTYIKTLNQIRNSNNKIIPIENETVLDILKNKVSKNKKRRKKIE